MKEDESETEAIFPISVLELDRNDIENAIYTFEDRTANLLRRKKWDKDLMEKIVAKLRRRGLQDVYLDLLPSVIKEVFMEEIEEMNTKRGFLIGLKEIIKRDKKK